MSSFFRACHLPNSALSPLLKTMMPIGFDPITRRMIGLPHVKLEATDFFDTYLSKKPPKALRTADTALFM